MQKRSSVVPTHPLVHRPEEVVYRSCYAPADLESMLQSAESRSKIRALPAAQLFFSVKELEEDQIVRLLPHITEEQWTTILDLDLWSKDEIDEERFLHWERHLLNADAPVARKIIRATDPVIWSLVFRRELEIFARQVDGEFPPEAEERGQLETPDRNFLLVLPRNPEKARLYQLLIAKLYELDAETAALLLQSSRFQTSLELEEEAFQNRRRRIEDLGFQDYFDAIEIYTYRPPEEPIPEKQWEKPVKLSVLPVRLPRNDERRPMLLFRAFARVAGSREAQLLVEELFYVCNKLLSADRISPDEPFRIKQGIRKALAGLNLGLDHWSEGDLAKATEGITRYYLLSYFQIGYSLLTDLQKEAAAWRMNHEPMPGSLLEKVMDGLQEKFPVLIEPVEGRIQTRFFHSRADLSWVRDILFRHDLRK